MRRPAVHWVAAPGAAILRHQRGVHDLPQSMPASQCISMHLVCNVCTSTCSTGTRRQDAVSAKLDQRHVPHGVPASCRRCDADSRGGRVPIAAASELLMLHPRSSCEAVFYNAYTHRGAAPCAGGCSGKVCTARAAAVSQQPGWRASLLRHCALVVSLPACALLLRIVANWSPAYRKLDSKEA